MIERIQAVLKIVRQKIAETLALPYAKLYIALAAFMTIVFIIFTFPYDLLIRKQIRLMESSIGRSVQVGAIDFSLIGDTFIDDIEIVFKDGGELSLKDISMNVAVNPVTLLLNKTLRGKVAVQNMKYTKGALSIQNLLDAGFDLTFDKDGIPREGFLNLTV
jgi:CRISPR/Cas system CMR subunit Cmr4 (Cas7 group RAMP superfamily)